MGNKVRFLFLLLFLVSCTVPTPTISERADILKVACNSACIGDTSATVLLPEQSTLYTSEEAICIKTNKRLYCSTCACDTYGLIASDIASTEEAKSITCHFKSKDFLEVSCSFDSQTQSP